MKKLCSQCGVNFFVEPHEGWKKICLTCWKKNKNLEKPVESDPLISQEMLRRLIYLCHPDKHDNSDASKKATQWLLRQKGERL